MLYDVIAVGGVRNIDIAFWIEWGTWALLTGGLVFFSSIRFRSAIPIFVLAFIIVALSYYGPPPFRLDGAAVYSSVVLTCIAAAVASRCRYYEIAAWVLALISVIGNLTIIFFSVAALNYTTLIVNGPAVAYFLWQAMEGDDDFQHFHFILGALQLLTVGLCYASYLEGAFPGEENLAFHFWLAKVMNRLFDLQLILILFCARMKIHGKAAADSAY